MMLQSSNTHNEKKLNLIVKHKTIQVSTSYLTHQLTDYLTFD